MTTAHYEIGGQNISVWVVCVGTWVIAGALCAVWQWAFDVPDWAHAAGWYALYLHGMGNCAKHYRPNT